MMQLHCPCKEVVCILLCRVFGNFHCELAPVLVLCSCWHSSSWTGAMMLLLLFGSSVSLFYSGTALARRGCYCAAWCFLHHLAFSLTLLLVYPLGFGLSLSRLLYWVDKICVKAQHFIRSLFLVTLSLSPPGCGRCCGLLGVEDLC